MTVEFVRVTDYAKYNKKGVVMSYPRSGRSWLRASIKPYDDDIFWEHGTAVPNFFGEHSVPEKGNYLFLVRDPRDIVCSYYFFMKHIRKDFEGTMDEFLCDKRWGIERIVEFLNLCPEHGYPFVRYEDIHNNWIAVLKTLQDTFGGQVWGKPRPFARNEHVPPENQETRAGVIGDHVNHFDPDAAVVRAAMEQLDLRLGYF